MSCASALGLTSILEICALGACTLSLCSYRLRPYLFERPPATAYHFCFRDGFVFCGVDSSQVEAVARLHPFDASIIFVMVAFTAVFALPPPEVRLMISSLSPSYLP